MKKYVAVLGSGMFFVICVSLYLMMESVNSPAISKDEMDEMALHNIEVKIKQIENDLNANQKTINAIKDSIHDIAYGNVDTGANKLQTILQKMKSNLDQKSNFSNHDVTKTSVPLSGDVCRFTMQQPPKADIQMLDVYDSLPFDNPDGGVWKQGYPISYDANQWTQHKLKVFVVPHSHNDPGWLKTFEKYYSDQTRNVFNNMVNKLEQHEKMKFIYAEMSFFSLWWSEINLDMKNRVKKLIERGKLEIVAGGWVMTDEANAHYFAMLDQMIEGNLWLLNQLGVTAKNGWAIDPFGHSPTMAYLLKRMGFSNMLIQRTHYVVKKHLSKTKDLEFKWRQNWDHSDSTDMLCHMMPFYSYDVPHTCGPDPSICCQFDFKRLPGGRVNCPWRKPPLAINSANVQQRAEMLLDQYRKKAQLYKSNVLLVPLGDDFRYDTPAEWDNQYNNYQQLFDYMNSHPQLHVEAQFGTLSDYFSALHADMENTNTKFPVLSGDFFSYADRDDHYWTGYFTSRPFQKRLDRVVEAHLRGGEILFTQAVSMARKHQVTSFPETQLMKQLVEARRALGLFQHHDGITGTAKDFVVNDYGVKLLNGLNGMKNVIKESAHLLMTDNPANYQSGPAMFDVDEVRPTHDSLPERTVLKLSKEEQQVVFYNSLAQNRNSIIRLYVDSPYLKVEDSNKNVIQTQVDPFWNNNNEFSQHLFKVVFVVSVPALGMSKYTIVKDTENKYNTLSVATIYNSVGAASGRDSIFQVNFDGNSDIIMQNSDISIVVSKTEGTLQAITLKETGCHIVTKTSFLLYGVTNKKDRSGAYLFLPDGPARAMDKNGAPFIRFIHGPLMSEVHSMIDHVEHVIRIQNSPGIDGLSVDINNIVDIKLLSNKELVMRIETDVKNNDRVFYTDLNGYQIQRRKTMDKLPMQANFYPMPSAAFIEDSEHRFNVLSAQSLGVASLKQGWIEIIQDRRLNQDDNRGLMQGVLDNRRTPNRFRILVEKRIDTTKAPPRQPNGYMSLLAQMASQDLIHPIHVLPKSTGSIGYALKNKHEPISDLPCDLHVVNWKVLQDKETDVNKQFVPLPQTGLIFHRYGLDCSYPTKAVTCSISDGQISISKFFKDLNIEKIQSCSLNLIHEGEILDHTKKTHIPPMEIKAYKLTVK